MYRRRGSIGDQRPGWQVIKGYIAASVRRPGCRVRILRASLLPFRFRRTRSKRTVFLGPDLDPQFACCRSSHRRRRAASRFSGRNMRLRWFIGHIPFARGWVSFNLPLSAWGRWPLLPVQPGSLTLLAASSLQRPLHAQRIGLGLTAPASLKLAHPCRRMIGRGWAYRAGGRLLRDLFA